MYLVLIGFVYMMFRICSNYVSFKFMNALAFEWPQKVAINIACVRSLSLRSTVSYTTDLTGNIGGHCFAHCVLVGGSVAWSIIKHVC